MRTKKAILNFIIDAIPQFIISLIGFIRIKVMLTTLGEENLAIYQLFGQLLAYVSLAELGLTAALSFTLYEPIFKNDHKKINSLLSGSRKVFNIIFIIMMVIGMILTLNISFFIKETTLNIVFIEVCFFLMMFSNIITYVVVPYTVLYDSEQNKYRYAKYTQIVLLIKAIMEIIIILIFRSLLMMLIMNIIFAVLQNIIIIYLCKKDHKWLSLNEKEDYSFVKKTYELVPHKIGMLIANNIDVVIISKFLGLAQIVAYTSYMYIVNTLSNILSKINTATISGIGNLMVENKINKGKKVYTSFLEYNAFVFFLATIICIPLYCVMSQFISLVYGSEYVLSNFTVFLFVFLVFYSIIRNDLNIYANAAGLFKETLICVTIEVIMNLSLSLILVKYIGITGVLLATVLSYIISEYLIKPSIINKYVFKDKISTYYKDCFIYIIYIVIFGFIFSYITKCIYISNLIIWFIYGVLVTIFNFIFTFIYYYFVLKRRAFIDRFIRLVRRK